MKTMSLALVAWIAYSNGVRAQEQTALDTFVFDPHNAHHERSNGNAAIVLSPRFDDSNQRTIGMFCHPVLSGSATTRNRTSKQCRSTHRLATSLLRAT
jgi:hypothetical protein